MSKIEAVAHVVGRELGDLEKDHLAHVGNGIALLSSLIAAGRSLDVPFKVQQRILTPAIEAVAKLAQVGEGYVQTHNALAAYVRQQGLEPSAYGETDPGPAKASADEPDRVHAGG